MAVQEFRIKPANYSDFKSLLDFYPHHRSDVLPLETSKSIGDALDLGRILLVMPESCSDIAATGALFQLTPQASLTYVGELAAMRVMHMVGGLEPLSMQQVLVGLRVLGFIALESEPLLEGATNSIITAVHRENGTSRANIEAMGLKPMPEPFPDWLVYNRLSYGLANDDTWQYYYADHDTCVRSIERLASVGLFSSVIRLSRRNKNGGQFEQFELHLELAELRYAFKDFKAIQAGKQHVALVRPPPSLLFPR